jgi:ABC-2 type transport system permease protein
LINAIVTPLMVVSGVFFSYHNFPEWSIPFIRNLPLTILADTVRSIMNEGTRLIDIYREVLILAGTGTICFMIGLKIFKWY